MTDLPAVPGGPPLPGDTPTDADRQFRIDQVQHALANDVIEFDQVDDYFEEIYRASTRQELEAAVSNLPATAQPPPPVSARHLAPLNSFAVIGDVKVGGWLDFGPVLNANGLIGDIVIDVSSASIPPEGLEINARGLVGDTKIILPDGARVQSNVTTIIGDRKEILVEPAPGGPTIRINAMRLIGDVKVYSLSEVPVGKLRQAWTALRRAAN